MEIEKEPREAKNDLLEGVKNDMKNVGLELGRACSSRLKRMEEEDLC